jgi:DinB superfamily
MDEVAEGIIDRETALAKFDHARDDFEAVFAEVPDEALDWMPKGDDYSFGTILVHVRRSIEMYSALLDMIRTAEFEEVRLAAVPGNYATVEEQPKTNEEDMGASVRLGPIVKENRQAALDALDAAHDRLAAQLRDLAEEYSRPAPVVYVDANEPYPTRASDVIKWLTDHYEEHVPQFRQMLEQWREGV